MPVTRSMRHGIRTTTVGGALAAVTFALVTPVAAAGPPFPEPVSVSISAPNQVQLPAGGQATVPITLTVPENNGNRPAASVTLTVRTTDAADSDVLDFGMPPNCTRDPATKYWQCGLGTLAVGKHPFQLGIKRVGTPRGAATDVTLTAFSWGGPSAGARMRVEYDKPGPLAVTQAAREITSKPGGTARAPMGVQNNSGKPVGDAALLVEVPYGLEFAQRFANCRYGTASAVRQVAVCGFDTAMQPGEAFTVDPVDFAVAADAPVSGMRLTYTFGTADEIAGRAGVALTPGTGKKLGLTKSGDTAPDKYASSASHTVLAQGQTSRVTAAPVAVKAAVGKETDMRIAVRNEGAATLNTAGSATPAAFVFLPKDVAVVGIPADCRRDDHAGETEGLAGRKPAGGSVYVCSVPPGDPWKPATARDFAFRVRLDAAFADVRTSVVAVGGTGRYEAADLTFDTTGGAGGNQPGNGGPELAETGGSSSSTGLIAGVGGGLLVVAAGSFYVARRRKGTTAA